MLVSLFQVLSLWKLPSFEASLLAASLGKVWKRNVPQQQSHSMTCPSGNLARQWSDLGPRAAGLEKVLSTVLEPRTLQQETWVLLCNLGQVTYPLGALASGLHSGHNTRMGWQALCWGNVFHIYTAFQCTALGLKTRGCICSEYALTWTQYK